MLIHPNHKIQQKTQDYGITDLKNLLMIHNLLHKSLASFNCYCSENEKQRLETAKLTLPGTKNNNDLKDDNVYIINSDISLNGSTDNDNSTNDTDTNAKDNISDDIGSEDNTTKYTDDNEDDAEFISSHNSKKRPLNEIHNVMESSNQNQKDYELYHGLKLKIVNVKMYLLTFIFIRYITTYVIY